MFKGQIGHHVEAMRLMFIEDHIADALSCVFADDFAGIFVDHGANTAVEEAEVVVDLC